MSVNRVVLNFDRPTVKFVSRNLVTRKVSLNFEAVGMFYEFLSDMYRVKPENGILKNLEK